MRVFKLVPSEVLSADEYSEIESLIKDRAFGGAKGEFRKIFGGNWMTTISIQSAEGKYADVLLNHKGYEPLTETNRVATVKVKKKYRI